MDEYFASLPMVGSTVLCVGGITRNEASGADAHGAGIDGFGYYLFLADESSPEKPVEILAKFLSPSEAQRIATLFARKTVLSAVA